MTTTRRTLDDMQNPSGGSKIDSMVAVYRTPMLHRGGRSGGAVRQLGRTVNQTIDVYPQLPRNVDSVPWLARRGYVKKPLYSSTYECVALVSYGQFMESTITNAKLRLTGLKVLVIDDSKTIRRTAETLLTKEGCEVFTAVDGFDALSKIADHQPDIVFVDIMMPRLDGYQTCSLIKHNKVFKQIPVIMLSSKDGLFDRARGRIVGSEHYLTKPFTKDELLGAIEAHVGK
jgi:twitching motility two-component system response regulator PilG